MKPIKHNVTQSGAIQVGRWPTVIAGLMFALVSLTGQAQTAGLPQVAGAVADTVGDAVASAARSKVLHVTNWGEYIAEDTIANFEKEFGVKVVYDTYDSSEAIDSKLLAGGSGYDVVLHASELAARTIPTGLFRPLDKSKLPNLKHMRADIMTQLAGNWDPDNAHIVPYMWGTHGVTYNEELVRSVHPDAPIGSLDLIFQPEHMKKLAQCGVAFFDAPTDVLPMALAYLGLDPNSKRAADYAKAEAMLLKIRPYIKAFDNYAYQRMPQKEFCVAVTFGPDGLLAMSGARDADTGVVLDFFLPPGKNAARMWVDGWLIPKDAENVDNAHLFINYMMRPEVAANDSNYTWYASANQDAIALIDEAVTGSLAAFPPPQAVEQMYTLAVIPPKSERIRTRTWTNFKAGK